MIDSTFTDPRTAALSKACEDTYQAASNLRREFIRCTVDYAAALLRAALPDAAFVTVDTDGRELCEVRDVQGKRLWVAAVTPVSPLGDDVVDDVEGLLRDLIPFGGLEQAGWKTSSRGGPYMDVRLPDVALHAAPEPGLGAARVAVNGTLVTARALIEPDGPASFHITGLGEDCRETRDRIRAAIINSAYRWPAGMVAVHLDQAADQRRGSTCDLAIACAILSADGELDQSTLDGLTVIGELGLNGRIRPVLHVDDSIRAAQAEGYATAVVSEEDLGNADVADVGIHGLATLGDAFHVLESIPRRR